MANIKSFLGCALVCLLLSACENSIDPSDDLTSSVTGKVVLLNTEDSSKPFNDHSGVTVALEGTSLYAITDTSGEYTISNVPSGSYTITYTKLGFDSVSNNLEYSGSGIDSLDKVILHSLPINSIRGRIILRHFDLDTEFADRSGVTISLVGTAFSTTTNQEGEYQLNNVPAGTYTLRLEKPGFYTEEGSLTYNGIGIRQLKTITLLTYTEAYITLDPITIVRAGKLMGRDFVDSVVIGSDTTIYVSGQAISSQLNLMLFSGKANLIDHNSITIRLENIDGKRASATSTKLATSISGNNYTIIADATYVQAYLDGTLEGKPTEAYLEAFYKGYDLLSNKQSVPHP